jgi:hypothetical protein
MNRRQFLQSGWRQFGEMLPDIASPLLDLTPLYPNLGESQSQSPSCFPDQPKNEEINNPSGREAD